jgi:hypothetical protein
MEGAEVVTASSNGLGEANDTVGAELAHAGGDSAREADSASAEQSDPGGDRPQGEPRRWGLSSQG